MVQPPIDGLIQDIDKGVPSISFMLSQLQRCTTAPAHHWLHHMMQLIYCQHDKVAFSCCWYLMGVHTILATSHTCPSRWHTTPAHNASCHETTAEPNKALTGLVPHMNAVYVSAAYIEPAHMTLHILPDHELSGPTYSQHLPTSHKLHT